VLGHESMIHTMRDTIRRLTTFSTVLAAGATISCATTPVEVVPPVSGARIMVEASADNPPEWVVHEPESDTEFHYFRGFRSDAPSLEGGETDARHNAMSHIIAFLGLRVEVDYERMRTEDQTQIRDAITSVGGADIFGTRLNELYYRRWRISDGTGVEEAYDVYALIRFPRSAVEMIRRNQEERLAAIRDMISGPGFMTRPGESYAQVIGAANALAAVNELNRSVLITSQTENDALELAQQAESRLNRLLGKLQIQVSSNVSELAAGSQSEPCRIEARVVSQDAGASAVVPNIPVSFVFADSTRVIWTGADGKAVWEMHTIPQGYGTREITARIDLPSAARAMPEVVRNAPVAATTIEVVPVSSLTTLLVLLDERSDTQLTEAHPRMAEARLTEALRKVGFKVISIPQDSAYDIAGDPWTSEGVATALAQRSGATVLVRGTIISDTPTSVDMMPGVFFTKVEVRLSLISVHDGQVVGSIVLPDDTIPDTRGFGNSHERAVSDAMDLDRNRQPNGYTYVARQVDQMLAR
jgi:hypothetical protein